MYRILYFLSFLIISSYVQAQNFSDYFKVTYENKEIKSGETLVCETTDADKSRYECDYFVEPLMEPELLSLTYRAIYLDSPTYEESLANRAMWGTPTICYVMGPNANCIPGRDNIISQYTFEKMTATLELQMHLDGEIDLSTFSFKLPEKAGTYRIILTGAYNGKAIEGEFVTDILIGPDAKGNDKDEKVGNFTDYFKVTYENKEIKSGETLVCETTDADKSRYECDYFVEPLMEPELLSLSYRAIYLGSPTYEESLANRAMWGTPTVVYVMGPNANCIPGRDNIISQYTFEEMTGTLELQLHLDGEIDLSNFTFKLPEKAGTYRVILTGAYNGKAIEGEFVTDILIGPDAKGNDKDEKVGNFTDYFKVTYENKEIKSGETLVCETTDADKSRYECDYFVEPLMDPELLSLSYRAIYLDSPTYEESLANRAMWGTPTICYVMGPNANCIPGHDNIISQYTFEKMTATLELQMHLDGEIDLSTFSFKLPEKAGTYRIILTGAYNGKAIEGEFVTDILIGPEAKGNHNRYSVEIKEMIKPEYIKKDTPFKLKGKILNNSKETIYDIKLKAIVNDLYIPDIDVIVTKNEIFPKEEINFTITNLICHEEGLKIPLKIILESINGIEQSEFNNNYFYTFINSLSDLYPKKFVVEEHTGSWCGYAPRGIVAMNYMKERFEDKNFIGISIHTNDEMAISSYPKDFEIFQSCPFAIINRNKNLLIDPSPTNLEEIYNDLKNEMTIANVTLDTDISEDNFEIRANVNFTIDQPKSNYKLSFIVIEDNVGPYNQRNYYKGKDTEASEGWFDYEKWCDKEDIVETIYHDVARTIYNFNGLENSLPSNIDKNITYNYTTSIPLNNINDINNSGIIALLINGETDEIINATKLTKYSNTYNNIIYKINEKDSSAIISGYIKSDTSNNIEIPAEIIHNGKKYNVSEIDEYAFKECEILENIILPSTIRTIGEGAFSDCISLKKIKIPENVTFISNYLFANCYNLEKIYFPQTIEAIGENAFFNCSNLRSISIPEGIISIPSNMAQGCSSLSEIILPNSIITIGENAFKNCTSLRNIDLGTNIYDIANYAFEGCENIKNIYSMAFNPPYAESYSFPIKSYDNATVIVKEQSLSKYIQQNPWYRFSNFLTVPGSISLSHYEVEMAENEVFQLGIYGATSKILWTSSNPTVAYANECGLIVAMGKLGSTIITAHVDGEEINCRVSVTSSKNNIKNNNTSIPKDQENIEPVDIIIESIGGTPPVVNARLVPVGSRTVIEWECSDNDIAFIENGIITLFSDGEIEFSTSTKNGLVETLEISTEDLNKGSAHIESYEFLNKEIQNNNVYDITGRLLITNASQEQINRLNKGLYIIGEKKIIIK